MTEEVRTTSSTGGQKGVKPARMGLLPIDALLEVATLYGKGAEKYDAHNWRRGYEWSKSYDALQRHAMAFWNGEDFDPELGTPHMASVVFHALTLLTFMKEQPDFDDRFVPETVGNPHTKPVFIVDKDGVIDLNAQVSPMGMVVYNITVLGGHIAEDDYIINPETKQREAYRAGSGEA